MLVYSVTFAIFKFLLFSIFNFPSFTGLLNCIPIRLTLLGYVKESISVLFESTLSFVIFPSSSSVDIFNMATSPFSPNMFIKSSLFIYVVLYVVLGFTFVSSSSDMFNLSILETTNRFFSNFVVLIFNVNVSLKSFPVEIYFLLRLSGACIFSSIGIAFSVFVSQYLDVFLCSPSSV